MDDIRCYGLLSQRKQINERLMLYAKLGGYGGSSTRSELAAGMSEIVAQGPIHLVCDSKCFIDSANKLLDEIEKQIGHTK